MQLHHHHHHHHHHHRCLLLALHACLCYSQLDLLIVGDWGGMPVPPYYTPGQLQTSKGMDKVASKLRYLQAVLALGDNFYSEGIVGNEDSHRFTDTWDQVYSGSNLQIPWFVVAGNHDHIGNVTAQISYSALNDRWNFPALYYSKIFITHDMSLQVIFIDTVDLAGLSSVHSEEDPSYFDKLPPHPRRLAATQWTWIEEQMESSSAEYLIVAGHYPVYSICDHGNTQTLIDHLQPLLTKYGAHYLSGHDHCMESLEDSTTGTQYVVTGMGDTCCYNETNLLSIPSSISNRWYLSQGNKARGTLGGFSSLTADSKALSFSFYDQDGVVKYRSSDISPRTQKL